MRTRNTGPLLPAPLLASLLLLLPAAPPAAGLEITPVETQSLAEEVAAGKLPPVGQRVPSDPAVAARGISGRHGGELRMLMAGSKDTRLMVVYGYSRLVRYTPELELVPDILRDVDVEAGRIFTLHLRSGHKWSDGQPFSAEDFRYWYEDVTLNDKLSPSGVPHTLVVEGERPKVEIIDPTTVRYSWSKPNPLFLPALAGPSPLYIYMPAHYLKQFHAKYADKATLEDVVKKAGVRNWAALHQRMDNQYRNDNPDLPTLEPWVLATRPPAERFVFKRNPYYHRIDAAGRQLPYIDQVAMSIADSKIIPAKTGAGDSDLQARYLRFDNYTFLKEAEKRQDFTVRLWRTAPGSQVALYPNLNVNNPTWRRLMRDVRFRRALSLAINRHEINQALYYGLAIEGQNTLLPQSPLFEPAFRSAWAGFDLGQANALLDEIGLTKRDDEGIRLLPDGEPLQIVVETAGDSTEQTDLLELVRDSWRSAGIKLFSKPSQLQVFRNRIFAGETMMAADKGVENGLPTAEMPPTEFAPVSQQQLEWPKWGQYYETKGKAGEPVDLPEAKHLLDLYKAWFEAATHAERERIWEEMLAVNADQVFTIGTIAGVLQPVVVSRRLRNVPEQGIYNWDPGAHFGIYSPDTFWLEPPPAPQASAAAAAGAAAR
jgi:peptide/nickel transport system substrate-binding protein